MAIPKFISHPLLLLTGGLLVGVLVWSRLPSEADLQSGANIARPDTKIFAPGPDFRVQIAGLSVDSCVFFKNDPHVLCFDPGVLLGKDSDPDFMPKFDILKPLLLDKWIRKEWIDKKKLTLPLELWDDSCFTTETEPPHPELCPMRLEP